MKYVIQIDADINLLTLNKMMNTFLNAMQRHEIDIKEYSILEVKNES